MSVRLPYHNTRNRLFPLLVFALLLILSGCASTANKTARTSLSAPSTIPNVVLMPIDVELSLLTAGGVQEPRADWTETAKKNIKQAFTQYQATHPLHIVDYQKPDNDVALDKELSEIIRLHGVVGQSIIVHEFINGLKLPSKGEFQWTLGPEVSALKQNNDADYALFVFMRDSYSSSGRIALQLAAALFGVGLQGGTQVGFASLVDLKSGDIIWFNEMASTTGDLRTAESADSAISYLLDGLPQ